MNLFFCLGGILSDFRHLFNQQSLLNTPLERKKLLDIQGELVPKSKANYLGGDV